jgi:hypothetical protein
MTQADDLYVFFGLIFSGGKRGPRTAGTAEGRLLPRRMRLPERSVNDLGHLGAVFV